MYGLCRFLVILTAIFGMAANAKAATHESVLHAFLGGTDGSGPRSNLVGDPKSALYGTTGNAIYQLTPPTAGSTGWTRTTIYTLRPKQDGAVLGNLLLAHGGTLYGTASAGGTSATCCGTVFALKPNAKHTAWTFSVLYQFKGGKDGGGGSTNPITPNFSQLVMDRFGALYGSTLLGGAGRVCCGTVFKLDRPATGQTTWTKTTLHVFKGTPDGIEPVGPLYVAPNGKVFGTTLYGGSNSLCDPTPVSGGCGTIFELTPPASGQTDWTETLITPAESMVYPYSGLISDGKGGLYGTAQVTTTRGDSEEWGSVFRVTAATPAHPDGTYQDIYYFAANADGRYPEAGLTIDNTGALFGTTLFGGTNFSCPEAVGCGTVFKLVPTDTTGTSWKESILQRFSGLNGEKPMASLLLGSDGALYGTTIAGGARKDGIIFQLTQ